MFCSLCTVVSIYEGFGGAGDVNWSPKNCGIMIKMQRLPDISQPERDYLQCSSFHDKSSTL